MAAALKSNKTSSNSSSGRGSCTYVLALSITPTQDGTSVVTGETKLELDVLEGERERGREGKAEMNLMQRSTQERESAGKID
jgi:hypothetical protein